MPENGEDEAGRYGGLQEGGYLLDVGEEHASLLVLDDGDPQAAEGHQRQREHPGQSWYTLKCVFISKVQSRSELVYYTYLLYFVVFVCCTVFNS